VRYPRLWAIAGWLMVGAIVWLSVTPSPPDPGFENADKLEHVLAYGVLTFWFCQVHASARVQLAFAAGFIALGAGLEFVQGALAYRTYDEYDMLANAIGVVAGWAVARATGPNVFARVERLIG
jgi:VanZ family protein